MTGAAIRTRDLSRRFGSVQAVDELSLEVPAAAIFGFLGPNGSGKTTAMRMLCGLLTPTSGSVEVLGLEIPRDAEQLRPRVGYMTQRFSLYDDLTVSENLSFMARIYSLARASRRQRVAELIAEYRLARFADRTPSGMSGGERQRLALAAATIHRPELLFLDEPTSAVDPESRRDFWESLFRLVDGGTTILVSTHYMDEAERCHGLAILDHGALVASGSPSDLKRDLDAALVEVRTADPRGARAALHAVDGVLSFAQLGSRIHVLVARGVESPEQLIRDALLAGGVSAQIERGTPSLEDVFVVATR